MARCSPLSDGVAYAFSSSHSRFTSVPSLHLLTSSQSANLRVSALQRSAQASTAAALMTHSRSYQPSLSQYAFSSALSTTMPAAALSFARSPLADARFPISSLVPFFSPSVLLRPMNPMATGTTSPPPSRLNLSSSVFSPVLPRNSLTLPLRKEDTDNGSASSITFAQTSALENIAGHHELGLGRRPTSISGAASSSIRSPPTNGYVAKPEPPDAGYERQKSVESVGNGSMATTTIRRQRLDGETQTETDDEYPAQSSL